MLDILRKKKTQKRILWFLAAIIVPAFVLWGAGSVSKRESPYKYIGVIEGKKVPLDDFVKGLRDVRVNLFLNFFSQPELFRKLLSDKTLINNFAWEKLIVKESAKKNKISVSDKEVIAFVTTHPLFSRGGGFDDKTYNYVLRYTLGMTARDFEESVRDALINTKLREGIAKGVAVSDEEVLMDYKEKNEKVKLNYVVIDKDGFKDGAEPAESEITDFYEKNKTRYEEPEKAVLEYIAFPHKEEGRKERAVKDLQEVYENLKETPYDMKNKAKELNLEVKETPPFARGEFVPGISGIKDVSRVPFELKDISSIVPVIAEGEVGTSYIIRVKEKIPPRVKTKDEARALIVTALKGEKAIALAKEKAENIYEKSAKQSLSLKSSIRKLKKEERKNLEVRETELISRSDYIEGIGEAREAVDKAFGLEKGRVSEPIKIRKGFALIEPVEFEFIDEKKFEEEKADYRTKLLDAKKAEAFQKWLQNEKLNSTLTANLDKL